MPRLEFLRFFQKADNLIKIEEGFLNHFDDFIFVAIQTSHVLE